MMPERAWRGQRQSAPNSDSLDATTLQQLLTTQVFGRTMYILPSTTSTNDIVKDLARHGAPEGIAVVAEQQTRTLNPELSFIVRGRVEALTAGLQRRADRLERAASRESAGESGRGVRSTNFRHQ